LFSISFNSIQNNPQSKKHQELFLPLPVLGRMTGKGKNKKAAITYNKEAAAFLRIIIAQ
jgi:hypothetical protein